MRALGLLLLSLSLPLASLLPRQGDASSSPPSGGIATLLARDDRSSSFDFRSGGPGGRISEGEVRLDSAQIAFDVLAPDRISFGFVRDERVDVLDLGPVRVPPQERAADRAVEFPVALFQTLYFDGVRFGYVGPGPDRNPYGDADRILASTPPETVRHVAPALDHTYVVRVHREGVGRRDELFKFHVVEHVPGERMTIRWAVL